MRYAPCKVCRHSKSKHNPLWIGKQVCYDCQRWDMDGPSRDWEMDEFPGEAGCPWNYMHNYVPDNLAFIEKLAERRKLI